MPQGFAPKSEKEKPEITVKQTLQEWTSFFEPLEDPRGKQGREHDFLSIVMIAILATIAGAEGWDDLELYAESHQVWLKELLELRNGVPHADTYRRVFALINPEFGENCFLDWVRQIVTQTKGEVIALDGKQSKGSYDRNQKKSAIHVVSAWASENRLMLGQVRVKDKSNEITAIPALLNLLDLTGNIITLDAMGTQSKIADLIVQQGGDYVLSLKANHPKLLNAVKECFNHNLLNVTFYEDSSRIRQGHSPENFTLLRRMAISLLNRETNSKRSLRQKTKLAAMNCNYMFDVLRTALK